MQDYAVATERALALEIDARRNPRPETQQRAFDAWNRVVEAAQTLRRLNYGKR